MSVCGSHRAAGDAALARAGEAFELSRADAARILEAKGEVEFCQEACKGLLEVVVRHAREVEGVKLLQEGARQEGVDADQSAEWCQVHALDVALRALRALRAPLGAAQGGVAARVFRQPRRRRRVAGRRRV